MVKKLARSKLRQRIGNLTPEQLHQKSVAACANLCQADEFKNAAVIMMFLSLPKELDTSHAILKAFQQDKTVVVPTVLWHERHMIPVTIHNLDCEMKRDRHGLRAPLHGEPMPNDEIDLVVVPGLGFDDRGNRIGRGGGFYDRFLTHDGFRATICGLAFEEQVLDDIPVADHDVQLNMLITDTTVRHFSQPSPNNEELAQKNQRS